ncbi:hypothetical protein ACQP1P_38875 [Dactylosporangium sp. CA-052675]|uniref:hypothetical protein n=1 Tax=Dactylosporangium sp. CA-052675 TaxID=3239927 RepID=UPI003D906569
MTDRPVLYQLLEARLGEPLADYVAARRPTTSWRQLAGDLSDRTNTAVSFESLRTWFADDAERAA